MPVLNVCAGQQVEEGRVTKIWKRSGLGRLDMHAASAGDIVSISGAGTARIADTLGAPDLTEPLAPGNIEPPTLRCVCSPRNALLKSRLTLSIMSRPALGNLPTRRSRASEGVQNISDT
jgi:GTP-binding protein